MLKGFLRKKKGCRTCPYYKQPFVPPQIVPDAKMLILGEGPWTHEVNQHAPFVGPSGAKLSEITYDVGIDRDEDVNIGNVTMCKANPGPNGGPEDIPLAVIKHCRRLFVNPLVVKTKPNVIVALGNTALQSLLHKRGIQKRRGHIGFETFEHKGKTFTAKILPSFHPAQLLHQPQLTIFSIADFAEAKKQMESRKLIITSKKVDYRELTSLEDAHVHFDELEVVDEIALDGEMTGLDYLADDLICISTSAKPRTGRVLNFFAEYPTRIPWALNKELLQRLYNILHSGKVIYGQNFKFDLRFLDRLFRTHLGKAIDVHKINWYEILIMQVLWNDTIPKDLKSLAMIYTDIRYTAKELNVVRGGTLKKAPLNLRITYAAKDADTQLRVGKHLKNFLRTKRKGKLWKLFIGHEMEISKWFYEIELFGCHIDPERLKLLGRQLNRRLKQLSKKMFKMTGKKFNIRSNDELARMMFKKLKIKPSNKFRNKRGYSTGKAHIEWLIENRNHSFLALLQAYREYDQIKKMFVLGLRKRMDTKHLVHSDFLVHGTVTGRPSSKNPNILNIPRDKEFKGGGIISVRRIFTARPEHIMIAADVDQAEYRVVTLLANVKSILKDLQRGEDFHTLTAREMFGKKFKKAEAIKKTGNWKGAKASKKDQKKWVQLFDELRTKSKTGNFAMIYQSGDKKLASVLGIELNKAKKHRENFFKKFPEFVDLQDYARIMAWEKGYIELPINGRRRRFPRLSNSYKRSRQAREAFNTLSQGTAAYVVRYALVRICRRFRKEKINGFITNTVYDSIMAEVHTEDQDRAGRIIVEEMLKPVKALGGFVFPISIGSGNDWQECKKNEQRVTAAKEFHGFGG